MKTLYFDCGMGAAGDMLTAALLELHPEPDAFLQRLNTLGIPGVTFATEQAAPCGITGTRMVVRGEWEGGRKLRLSRRTSSWRARTHT